jgi:hypothetical protein
MKKLALIALLTMSCEKTGSSVPSVNVGEPRPMMPIDHSPIDPLDMPGANVNSALSRRMSIQQLENSLPLLFGNETTGNPPVARPITWSGFASRSGTLGEPDFIVSVDENLEASPLYLKFMGDLAREVCGKAMVAETKLAKQEERHVQRFVNRTDWLPAQKDAIDKNLRHLKTIFHGSRVDPSDDQPIAAYRKLFEETVTSAAAGGAVNESRIAEGWRTVCVAFLTSPEFHLY